MDTKIIIVAAAVVVILLVLVFWPFGGSNTSHNTSTYLPTSTASAKNGTTTTIVPAKVEFYGINYQWVYSGPASQDGNSCGYSSYTNFVSQTMTLNGSQGFDLVINPSTSSCGFTITSISATTSGFEVTSLEPTLPFDMPANSNAEMQINMVAPDVDYYGPLTLTIQYN
jgi:hypothetical protein